MLKDMCDDMSTLLILTSPITIPCAIIGYTGFVLYDMYMCWSIKNTVTPVINKLQEHIHYVITPICDKIALFMWSSENTIYIAVNSGYPYSDICCSISLCIQKYWMESYDVVIFVVDYNNITCDTCDLFTMYNKNNTDKLCDRKCAKPRLTIVNGVYDSIHNTNVMTMNGNSNIIGNIFDVHFDTIKSH